MFPDFKELLSVLNANKVKYLVVGGYAVSFHAQPRATKDLDIFVRPDADNANALYDALTQFGAPIDGLAPHDLIERGRFFRMGAPPAMVDILPEIKGVAFDEAWMRRVEASVDADEDVKAYFISADDLIAAKRAAGRLQDLADIEAIDKARGRVPAGRAKRRRPPRKSPRKPRDH
jgi:hypothetical protein